MIDRVRRNRRADDHIDWQLAGSDRRLTKAVVDIVARRGPTDRRALGELLGAGRATVSRAVVELLDARILVEIDTVPSGRGRPHTLLAVNPRAASAIGLDFGLRHIRGAIVDAAHNTLATAERETPLDYSPEAAVDVAAELVDLLQASAFGPVVGIGVALPGPVDRAAMSLTRSSILPGWAGVPVLHRFTERIPYPLFADNESNLAAYAEKLWGAASDLESMVYLKLHSGVGGALMSGDQILRGQHGGAGEFGHLGRGPSGVRCRCGNFGCLEASIGIPTLLATMSTHHGNQLSLSQAAQMLTEGDAACRAIVTAAGYEAGRALGSLSNVFDPQAIVLGGSLVQLGEVLDNAIAAGYEDTALPMHRETPIRRAELGRWASALGATGFVFASEFDDLLSRSWRASRP